MFLPAGRQVSSYVCYVSMWFRLSFLYREDFKLTHYPRFVELRLIILIQYTLLYGCWRVEILYPQ